MGQSDILKPSTISFYTVTSSEKSHDPPRKEHLYDFNFYNTSDYKVVQYYPPPDNKILPKDDEPTIKTVFLDVTHQTFFGCSSVFNDSTEFQKPGFQPGAVCSDALGSYTEKKYLFFTIHTLSPIRRRTFIRAEASEYRFKNDAPVVSLRYADPSGRLSDTVVLRTALTKRNSHTTLKVCGDTTVVTADHLGPLAVVMTALNEYAVYINRPKVYSL